MLLDNVKNYQGVKGVVVQHGETESVLNLAYLFIRIKGWVKCNQRIAFGFNHIFNTIV